VIGFDGRWDIGIARGESVVEYEGDAGLRVWTFKGLMSNGEIGGERGFMMIVSDGFARSVYYNKPWKEDKDRGMELSVEIQPKV
jgi:hypothetical protein